MAKKNVIIIGAAGRDFHNFNTYFRGNEDYNVVAFTAAQIPDIDGRKYPADLAGNLIRMVFLFTGKRNWQNLSTISMLMIACFHIVMLLTKKQCR